MQKPYKYIVENTLYSGEQQKKWTGSILFSCDFDLWLWQIFGEDIKVNLDDLDVKDDCPCTI